ncbi:MAG: PAS domain S-box protein, partial [Chloroflexi bacterium]|nr:PAS domain S-box protein [Chloroflexota bacterium]
MEDITGYPAEEVARVSLAAMYQNQDDRRALLQALDRDGKVVNWAVGLRRKDGTPYDAMLSITSVSRGSETAYQTICQDVTERRRAEEERQRIERLESVGTLAGGIAHDFNNLLTGIVGNIGLARRSMESGKGEEASVMLLEAESACLRAKDLTQQLLTFS